MKIEFIILLTSHQIQQLMPVLEIRNFHQYCNQLDIFDKNTKVDTPTRFVKVVVVIQKKTYM